MAVFDSDTKPYPLYSEGTPTRMGLDRQPTVGDVAGAFGNVTGVKPYTDAAGNLINRAISGVEQTHTANQQFIRDPTGANANANQFLRESNRGDKTPSSIPSFGPQLPTIQNPVGMVASHSADPRDVAMSARRTLGNPQSSFNPSPRYPNEPMARNYDSASNTTGYAIGGNTMLVHGDQSGQEGRFVERNQGTGIGMVRNQTGQQGTGMSVQFDQSVPQSARNAFNAVPNTAPGATWADMNAQRQGPAASEAWRFQGPSSSQAPTVDGPNYITVDQARAQGIGRKLLTSLNDRAEKDYQARLAAAGQENSVNAQKEMATNRNTLEDRLTGQKLNAEQQMARERLASGEPLVQAQTANYNAESGIKNQQFAGNQRTMDLQNIIADPSKSQEEKSRAAETLHILTGQPDKLEIATDKGTDANGMPSASTFAINPRTRQVQRVSDMVQGANQQPARKPVKGDTAFDKDGNALVHDGTGWMLKNPPNK